MLTIPIETNLAAGYAMRGAWNARLFPLEWMLHVQRKGFVNYLFFKQPHINIPMGWLARGPSGELDNTAKHKLSIAIVGAREFRIVAIKKQ